MIKINNINNIKNLYLAYTIVKQLKKTFKYLNKTKFELLISQEFFQKESLFKIDLNKNVGDKTLFLFSTSLLLFF